MKNKTVIRKKLVPQNFVSIHKTIIEDTRLSGNALRLLMSILGDSDETFNLSETTYCNRFKWEKKTFYRAIEDLEKCGYLKKTEISKDKAIPGIKKANSNKKVYHYTISEYGNLTSTSTSKVKVEKVIEETIPTQQSIEKPILKTKLPIDILKEMYGKVIEINNSPNNFLPTYFDAALKPYFNFNVTHISNMKNNISTFEEFCFWINQFEPMNINVEYFSGDKLISKVSQVCENKKADLKNNDIKKTFTTECLNYFESRKNKEFELSEINNIVLRIKTGYKQYQPSID